MAEQNCPHDLMETKTYNPTAMPIHKIAAKMANNQNPSNKELKPSLTGMFPDLIEVIMT